MEKKEYKRIVDKHVPSEKRLFNAFIAFVVGGIVGVIGQLLVDFYSYYLDITSKDAAVFMILTLILIASVCTALGFFDKLVTKFKCGLIIPITGFAHSMTSAGIEYKSEGPIFGLGSNVFKLAGSVIVYGVSSAFIFALIRYLFLGGA